MTYLSRRTREISEEDAVPQRVRDAARIGATVQFMGKRIDPITAWRISGVWPWEEPVSHMGRGA